MEIDGQTIQFNANGEVAIASGPEGAFQAVELDGNVDHTPTPDSDWGWMFYIDDAEGA